MTEETLPFVNGVRPVRYTLTAQDFIDGTPDGPGAASIPIIIPPNQIPMHMTSKTVTPFAAPSLATAELDLRESALVVSLCGGTCHDAFDTGSRTHPLAIQVNLDGLDMEAEMTYSFYLSVSGADIAALTAGELQVDLYFLNI